MSEVVSYKCPNCAAGLSFDIEKQSWACKFCMSDFTLEQLQKDQPEGAPREAEEQPLHWEAPEEHYDQGAAAFSCPSCGGHIVTDQNTAATFCTFCHNPTVIAARLEEEFRPAQVLPFKLEKEAVTRQLLAKLKNKPFLPRDFKEFLKKGEISGLYVPYWLFDADVEALLQGVGKRITVWSDRNYRYTKTDTYRVERGGAMAFRGLPADGSSRMDDALMEALEPYDYSQMEPFSMGYLSGHVAESYDVNADQASVRAMPRMRQGVEQLMKAQVSGYHSHQVTNLSVKTKNNKVTYVMLPVWTLTAQYRGKTYTYAMNGQTGKTAGTLPMSTGRIWAWFGAMAAVITVITWIGGMLL